ncbi:MAG: glycoside hydrolase domain-containing protein [Marinifilaceae bacterium]
MKKFIVLLGLFLLGSMWVNGQEFKPDASYYGVGFWSPDTLGNHRAVVEVNKPGDIIRVDIPWRRRDKKPTETGIIIIDATTGKEITNFYRSSITREAGTLLMEPQTNPGKYYVYYLPYKTSGGPYPKINYPLETTKPQGNWLAKARMSNLETLPQAKFVQFQSLSSFDSFYPMEVVATEKEKASLIAENPNKNYLIFPEDRKYSIRMFDDIPYRWAAIGTTNEFNGEADMNEYYVMQLGLWAFKKDIKNVKLKFSDLKGKNAIIPSKAFTCFNTEGVDWLRRPLDIVMNVNKGKVQPLWIGIDIPAEGISKGVYSGTITVEADGVEVQAINVNINISDHMLPDRGDNDINRLSRLRWLNSEFGFDNKITQPFIPITVSENNIKILGREVKLNKNGLPASISSYFTEEMTGVGTNATSILAQPIEFVIRQGQKNIPLVTEGTQFTQKEEGLTSWTSQNRAGNLSVQIEGLMEFDGFMEYRVKVKANENTNVDDIRLEVPMNAKVAKYWLGLGSEGSYRPQKGEWKWDATKNQEGYWFGDVNAGLQCLFRDNNYVRPLNTNFYQQKPLNMPTSWYNDGKGGITYSESKGTLRINSYSGARTLKKGEELNFTFLLSITPFKPIDTEKQWTDRYLHSHTPIDEVVEAGPNVVNIHHASSINPFINYPFIRPDYMKQYIDEAHDKGVRVKIYYTVRELANRAPELWALRSLGHEVFSSGNVPGYSWLREHLGEDYLAAWFVDKYKDAAIVNSGVSRWHNYYVEGLQWLVNNIGIDGLYIDDLAIDRTTMKRVRKILDRNRPAARIDLHSANQFNKSDGFINSAFLYMEHMPYLDRLWFGEYFKYEKGPDYWMTETAGIPFGMMGEMLEGDGDPWRGMLHGMTCRFRYHGKDKEVPKYFWKVWDDFGIKDSKMMGYWVSYNPIKTNNDKVQATSFIKDNKVMVVLASWDEEQANIDLKIDWKKLGIDKSKAVFRFPDMKTLQTAKTQPATAAIEIPKNGGCLLIIETT